MKRFLSLLLLWLVFSPRPALAAAPDQAGVIAQVAESVVSITVIKREIPQDPLEPPHLVTVSGSGFAVRSGGYILSNAHVLDHAVAAWIRTADDREYEVLPSQIWSDPVSDLSVARITADLTALPWAKPDDIRLGEPVFAMGAPYGPRFRGSVSRGIVSGVDRKLGTEFPFIQTDTPINPGNSGGPLFDANGEVVGVNARAISGADGMGFAIPASVAREVSDRLIRDGRIERAWLGLQFEEGEEADLGYHLGGGVIVSRVEPQGPAAAAGIEPGDTLVRVDQTKVSDLAEVGSYLMKVSPGTPVPLTYERGDTQRTTVVTLGSRPHDAQLYHSARGLWLTLTAAQQERARAFGRSMADMDVTEVADPWTVWSGGSRAVLETEFLGVARLAWTKEREGARLAAADAAAESQRRRGVVSVLIDLPVSFTLEHSADLWAQWIDPAGSTRALSVQPGTGAPPGFQRIAVVLATAGLEKTGEATLLLHTGTGEFRRFLFDLDEIH